MKNRNLILTFIDVLSSGVALYLAFLIRFEFSIPSMFFDIFLSWLPYFLFFQILVFYFMRMYDRIWRYTSLFDLYAIITAAGVSSGASLISVFLLGVSSAAYPRSVLILYVIFNTLFTIGIRLSVRVYYSHFHKDSILKNLNKKKMLLLVGAGKTGDKLAREILTSGRSQYGIVGFIDDNPDKQNGLLHGKQIFCGLDKLSNLNIQYDEIVITAPSASGDQMRYIVDCCKKTGKPYKTVPGLSEMIDKEITLDVIRDVSFADLLGREEVKLDMHLIKRMLKGKRVLITGAGGSIGSELVKQCITFEPAEMICLDVIEEKIYNLDQTFDNSLSKTIVKTVLANINNKKEIEKVFNENRPHIVFHAAAYKHVPLQELHPWMAVRTNIGGTLNLIELSSKHKVDKFVLVSTDKAVNPVNVMGATKRLAEKLIKSFNDISKTRFMSVRFGNVLGSSGSAIPTFQKQINKGGPITITHPEMTRYFMSIQEASQLILQSGSLGKGGEIFLLEMGKPIKILQMAKDLIRLSGYEPETDIPIVYTGLRPGEKLYEELQLREEKKLSTDHSKIMILKEENKSDYMAWDLFKQNTISLLFSAEELNSFEIQSLLKKLLPTYQPTSFEKNYKNQMLETFQQNKFEA
ncbi:MAG: hypothetical protein CMG55_03510 [Candidatus Marinimicrobia bacterium]|nr:hypothetical protein [Candidatus Neomarinimicrobiota bacterium]|tara:strand:- start:328 stop:2232 length:1905 start_codon:yes stop_codon:yes gene_type:complete